MKQLQTFLVLVMLLSVIQGMAQIQNPGMQDLKVEELREAEKLTDLIPEDQFTGTVESFEVTYRAARSGDLYIEINDGLYFNESVRDYFASIEKEDKIWIDNVQVKQPSAATISIRAVE